ncbi:hypothetical protein K8O93_00980 [Gordonia bronchialis]|uniref:hypothetical protein n=1 Tax=Gordonia bronchialis TaxID=2054 RepID=UPI001CC130FB|nr:hypothetical protein [Gordonia bronchialis]UAK38407.1 hypothetical protein K8O93_00980 [Gordonia bronchialis]
MKIKVLIAGALVASATLLGAGQAGATPGHYTRHGDVLVTVAAVGGCATVTWPKGYQETLCEDYDQVTHKNIVPGDRFGAKIVSWGNAGVACRVLDIESGDMVYTDSGRYQADCIRRAS